MTAPFFVDSNVFLYAVDDADREDSRLRGIGGRSCGESPGTSQLSGAEDFYVNAVRLRLLPQEEAARKFATCWRGIL